MTEINSVSLSKHFLIASIAFSLCIQISNAAFSRQQKSYIFEDCTIFNDTKLYGGEICGSDEITYANTMFLDCLNHRESTEVDVLYTGKCQNDENYCEPNPIYLPVCGTDNKTWNNVEALLCYNQIYLTKIKVKKEGPCEDIDHCVRNMTLKFQVSPVCASNGFTYQSIAEVRCLRRNNTNLRILYDGGCLVSTVHQLYGLGPEICTIAKRRYEWNPLCASDNQTYPNPFVFLCYQPHLRVASNHECGTSYHDACMAAGLSDKRANSRYIDDDYPVEEEVCGSDSVTYQSINHLQCQSLNNRNLYLKHTGRCEESEDDDPCLLMSEQDKRYVCGTNGITYTSPEALLCAKRRCPRRQLAYLHDGICA